MSTLYAYKKDGEIVQETTGAELAANVIRFMNTEHPTDDMRRYWTKLAWMDQHDRCEAMAQSVKALGFERVEVKAVEV